MGSVLVRKLLDDGYGVRVLDRLVFTDTSLASIKDRIELVRGDIRDIGYEIMQGIDAVIHLAGISTEPTSQFNPRLTDLFNHIGTERIARLAKDSGVERFIFASSCSVYFTYDTPLEPKLYAESDLVNPISPYSLSKRAAEQALLELEDERFHPVIFRKGTVYGWSPRMRYDLVVNSFTKDAFVSGTMTASCGGRLWRPLADIQDVANAYVRALEIPLASVSGKIFNVCSENWNIGQLAKRVKELINSKKGAGVEINTQEVGITRNYKADPALFDKTFQLKPARNFEDAVMEIWDKLEKNPDDAKNPLYYNDKWQIQLLEKGILH